MKTGADLYKEIQSLSEKEGHYLKDLLPYYEKFGYYDKSILLLHGDLDMRTISKLSARVESSNVTWLVISLVVVLVGGYILHLGGAF